MYIHMIWATPSWKLAHASLVSSTVKHLCGGAGWQMASGLMAWLQLAPNIALFKSRAEMTDRHFLYSRSRAFLCFANGCRSRPFPTNQAPYCMGFPVVFTVGLLRGERPTAPLHGVPWVDTCRARRAPIDTQAKHGSHQPANPAHDKHC